MIPPRKLIALLFGCLLTAQVASAASVVITNGEVIHGSVLQKTSDTVTVSTDYGVLRLSLDDVKTVDGVPPERIATPVQTIMPSKLAPTAHGIRSGRLPAWSDIIATLNQLSWATKLHQIPATVIDKGAMRNVPYLSFRCGED